jgi:hypothetical protein
MKYKGFDAPGSDPIDRREIGRYADRRKAYRLIGNRR